MTSGSGAFVVNRTAAAAAAAIVQPRGASREGGARHRERRGRDAAHRRGHRAAREALHARVGGVAVDERRQQQSQRPDRDEQPCGRGEGAGESRVEVADEGRGHHDRSGRHHPRRDRVHELRVRDPAAADRVRADHGKDRKAGAEGEKPRFDPHERQGQARGEGRPRPRRAARDGESTKEHSAAATMAKNEADGTNAIDQRGRGRESPRRRTPAEHGLRELDRGLRDDDDDRAARARGEGARPRAAAPAPVGGGDRDDEDEGRGQEAEHGGGRARRAAAQAPQVGRQLAADRAGAQSRERQAAGEVLARRPAAFAHPIALHRGDLRGGAPESGRAEAEQRKTDPGRRGRRADRRLGRGQEGESCSSCRTFLTNTFFSNGLRRTSWAPASRARSTASE